MNVFAVKFGQHLIRHNNKRFSNYGQEMDIPGLRKKSAAFDKLKKKKLEHRVPAELYTQLSYKNTLSLEN